MDMCSVEQQNHMRHISVSPVPQFTLRARPRPGEAPILERNHFPQIIEWPAEIRKGDGKVLLWPYCLPRQTHVSRFQGGLRQGD